MINKYLNLTKPKIIIGNLITSISGFLLASKHRNIDYYNLFYTILGLSLIIASSCVFNNFIDNDIDKIMKRTQNRISVSNIISTKCIFIYAVLLCFLGLLILILKINILTLFLIILGFIIYVLLYSLYIKRCSSNSIIIGSISGALPPVIGYCSVTNNFDFYALILFLIFIFWQIPHSYAIEIYHFQDYKKAKIPTFPIVKGLKKSKNHIILYIIMFNIFSFILTSLIFTNYIYLINISIMNIYWLILSLNFKSSLNYFNWSRKIFLCSILVVFNISLIISIDSLTA